MEFYLNIILKVFLLYFLVGAAFSVFMYWKSLKKIDTGVEGTGIGFKLLLLPGMLVFWPLFAKKWINLQ